MGALNWIGARARWVLLIGVFAGLAAPAAAETLRPVLPFFVAMVYALAMLRIDPVAIMRGLGDPRHAVRAFGIVALMLVATPLAAFGVARMIGAGPAMEAILVYTFAAPPIASAAAMCLIVGFRGETALELTVLSSLLMPFTGPVIAGALLGGDLDLAPVTLGLRMAAMIFGGFAIAMIGRRILGAARIGRNKQALDGLAALGFLLFVIPLFDGVRDTMMAEPLLALGFLVLSCVIILGGVFAFLWWGDDRARDGALGVVWGTRAVAIYFAALPPDPIFTLFVAIFQLPMAAIALVFQRRSPD